MKIDAIIIDQEPTNSTYLRRCLHSKFPEINVQGEATNYATANKLIKAVNPSLIFFDIGTIQDNCIPALRANGSHFETVYISGRAEDAISAIRHDACGFLLKPFNIGDIVISVADSIRRLAERASYRLPCTSELTTHAHTRLIGIPTMEGIEFLNASEIVRCEGLQKCTRIVTLRKNSIVSSYCIGEFRRLLDEHGFFSCHKSHLINLMYVRKLTREGFITMIDNVAVPLARRKRIEFLQHVKHL
jgi:two-component system LytT family response regulator